MYKNTTRVFVVPAVFMFLAGWALVGLMGQTATSEAAPPGGSCTSNLDCAFFEEYCSKAVGDCDGVGECVFVSDRSCGVRSERRQVLSHYGALNVAFQSCEIMGRRLSGVF